MAKKAASNEAEESADAEFLKSVRDVAFIAAVYLYFSGWTYVYFYYDFFGLSIKQVDVEFYFLLVYATNVLIYLVKVKWLYTALFILCAALLRRFIKISWMNYLLSLLLFIGLYFASYYAGMDDAHTAFDYNNSHLKNIQLGFAQEEKNTEQQEEPHPGVKPADTLHNSAKTDVSTAKALQTRLDSVNKAENLRLLASTKESFFVLVADTGAHDANVYRISPEVYEVKKEQVSVVKISN